MAVLEEKRQWTMSVMLDLATHLSSSVTLRMLRDTTRHIMLNKSVLVLIDCEDKLPEVVQSYARRFEFSLPTEMKLDMLILGVQASASE